MSPPAAPQKSAAPRQLSERAQLFVVLGIAAVCGLIAAVATGSFLQKERARALAHNTETVKTTPIVVARQDLNTGDALTGLTLDLVDWPQNHQPANGFVSIDKAVGRVVETKIFKGEPIVESRLVPQGAQAGMHIRIPEGHLGMSLRVDSEIGVSGFIKPGNRVDVIATLRRDQGGALSKVVLQNVLVLAVGQEMEQQNGEAEEVATITLAVTLEQAEMLAAARSEGGVMLALRNIHDDTVYETPGFSPEELARLHDGPADGEDQAADDKAKDEDADEESDEQVAAATSRVVEVFSGDHRDEVKFLH